MKLKLSLLFLLIYASLRAQPPHTFTSNNSIIVPAGVTTMTIQAWGGGGGGGGASGGGGGFGRSGAGGGGGAYATAAIGVTQGNTISAVVGVATSAAAASGANGNPSTITGFETTVYAAGGFGGGGNTTGNSPVGGAGGSVATSVGTTRTAGNTGGNGATSLLGLLFSSGAGGSAASPAGGVGGAAIGSVIGGSSTPGNAGGPPGGGGSGGMTNVAAGQNGGPGAAGQIIISYTCPTYNITGTSNIGACVTTGTSTVTVTAPAVNLPVGTYTVTFNRSLPAGTALTSTLTVLTAGTGTFPVTGLTTAGTSGITITKLESAACSSTISGITANIVVSSATLGGAVAGGTTICSGFTSAGLTLSTHNGAVLRWQSSVSPFSTWTDIANTTTTYTSGALTQTTQFRAVVQNGNCGPEFSTATTVTVNPLPGVVLSAATIPVCITAGAQNTTLSYTGATQTPTTYSIVWNAAPTNTFAAVTNAALPASPITIAIPSGTASGTYSGTLTVSNANGCVSSPGQAFNVVVNPLPATPTIGTITLPTCAVQTGTVALSGLPVGGTLISYPGAVTRPYTGTTATVSGLVANTYTFTVNNGTCTSLVSANAVVPGLVTNTYTTSWSNGIPTMDQNLVFAGDFSTGGNVNGCSCVVNSGVNVTVNSGHTLSIMNAVTNSGGAFIFENNASLLQTNNVTNTGNITYKRNSAPVRLYDYTYWSSPVKRTPAFTLNDLSPNTSATDYYRYDPNNGWISINQGLTEMLPGIGYIVAVPESFDQDVPTNYPATFVGIPNNGTIPVTIPTAEKWNLLGNPYPSAVYADQFIFNNSATLYGTLYFWTHNSAPTNTDPNAPARLFFDSNDYAAYNLTGSVGTGSGTGATTPGNQNPPLGYIAAGQGFFVKSKVAGTANFTNIMRVAANNTQFFKTTNNTNETNTAEIEKNRIWLTLSNVDGAFKQALIGYVTGATNGWDDNYDGTSFNGNEYLDFYSINETKKLTIQGRAVPFSDADVIPLGYKSTIAGEFSISIDRTDGIFDTQPIYLEDKLNGTIHDLKVANYTFTTAIGTFADRFAVLYANRSTLGNPDFENNLVDNVLVSVKDKVIKIAAPETISEVAVFDISGKLLFNKKKIEDTTVEITNSASNNQILLVKVILKNAETSTTKIRYQ
ncbi:hypothetical protein B4N84_05100 [Flavobacterium sp. IR1]|nr:hypothetical protein B4N84_05100 [Flavobacterium sp. IR1]